MNVFKSLSNIIAKGMKPVWNTHNKVASLYNLFKIVGRRYSKKDLYVGIVFACVNKISTAVSSTNFALYKKITNKEFEEVEISDKKFEVVRLLRRPNKHQTWRNISHLISSYLDIHGEAYIYPVRQDDSLQSKIVELWVLDSARVKVVRGKDFISGYVYRAETGEDIPFDAEELISIKQPHPFDQRQGVSTIEQARFEAEADLNAVTYNRKFFENGAIPATVLTTEQELSDEAFDRMNEEFKTKHKGSENAYKNLILESGLKFQVLATSQRDMDFLNSRKFSRDQVLAIFGIPKSVMAISDDVNRASAQVGMAVFAENTLEPRLALIFEQLTYGLLPLFKIDPEQYVLKHDNVIPEDAEQKLKEQIAGHNKWLTTNEIRAMQGYDAIEGGHQLYVEFSLRPIDAPEAIQTIKPDKENEEVDEKQIKRQAEILKLAVRGKTSDEIFLTYRDSYLDLAEKEYTKQLTKHFKQMVAEINAKGAKDFNGVEDALEAILGAAFIEKWFGKLKDYILARNTDALETGLNAVADIYGISVSFDMQHNGAIAWLTNRASETSVSVRDSVLKKARKVILAELESNERTDLATLKEKVASAINEQIDYRVERIVRTELITAYGKGTHTGYESSGVVEYVKWLTAGDDRVSERCKALNKQVRKLGSDFYSDPAKGGDGWTGKSEPSHVNCRCTTVAEFTE